MFRSNLLNFDHPPNAWSYPTKSWFHLPILHTLLMLDLTPQVLNLTHHRLDLTLQVLDHWSSWSVISDHTLISDHSCLRYWLASPPHRPLTYGPLDAFSTRWWLACAPLSPRQSTSYSKRSRRWTTLSQRALMREWRIWSADFWWSTRKKDWEPWSLEQATLRSRTTNSLKGSTFPLYTCPSLLV